jgi:Zn-dependent peptidase ImmA (M78 family)
MASDITAPILSYEDINRCAEEFLIKHEQTDTLPVDIEAIAEFNLGLNIFPFPGLQKTFDVEGFISGDLTTIYVDEFIYYQRPSRYRFTVAHEIGHYILHSEVMSAVHPQSVSEWKNFVSGIDEDAYDWLEWQAYTFAGAVLVPRIALKEHFYRELVSLQPKIELVQSKGLSVEASIDYIVDAIARKLIAIYDVSMDVLTRRINKEIEKGHLLVK